MNNSGFQDKLTTTFKNGGVLGQSRTILREMRAGKAKNKVVEFLVYIENDQKWDFLKSGKFSFRDEVQAAKNVEDIRSLQPKKEEVKIEYYDNGQPKRKTPYKFGEPDGIMEEYYESGEKKAEIPYKNGLKHGTVKEYYENGNIKEETPYINGERYGISKHYYESGKIEITTSYENGKINGWEIEYYEKGGEKTRTLYKDGKVVRTE
jgi:antitoxin component YwqK of YwqJK toxin-antitoxin module